MFGVFASCFGGGYDRAAMLDGPGRDLLGAVTLYKHWPCVGISHGHIKAVLDIVAAEGLAPGDIAGIRLWDGDYHRLMWEPLAERRAPATLADAKFALPLLVAVAAARGGAGVADFTPQGLRDPEVLAIAERVTLVPDPAFDWRDDLPPARVETVVRDGRRWRMDSLRVPGNADSPLTWDDIAAKFHDCAAAAARPVSAAQAARALDLAQRLETLPDATAVLRALD